MNLNISQNLLEEIFAESRRTWPEEGCGFVIGFVSSSGERTAEKFIAVTNIQNQVHEKDPVRYPRNAKTAYTIDPKEMETIQKNAESAGKKIISIVHSHPEHGVYFSAEDKEMAAPWGEPLFPEISYIVVSVYSGEVKNCSEFGWDVAANDFVENKIL